MWHIRRFSPCIHTNLVSDTSSTRSNSKRLSTTYLSSIYLSILQQTESQSPTIHHSNVTMELRWYEVSRSINQRYCKSIIENRLLEKLESHEYDVIFACAANFLYFIAVSDHRLIISLMIIIHQYNRTKQS